MDEQMKSTAHRCLAGAEAGSMTFPTIVAALAQAGFEELFRRLPTRNGHLLSAEW